MYDDISIFLKVVELGTYVRTAKHLKTTQSTISRRIQALEERLNTSLFKRNFRGLIETTEEGKIFFQKFYPLYKNLDYLVGSIINQNEIKGTLKVALPATISRSIISPFIPEFITRYPNVTLLIDYTSKPIDMMKDNYDIAVSSMLPTSKNSKIKLLHRSRFKLYASNAYVQKYGTPDSLKDLNSHQCIGLLDEYGEPVSNYIATNIDSDEKTVCSYQAKIYVNHAFQGVEMAINGDFIIGVWDNMIINLFKNKAIVPVLPQYSFGEQSYYLIREHHVYNQLEQLFAAFLEDKFAKIPDLTNTD